MEFGAGGLERGRGRWSRRYREQGGGLGCLGAGEELGRGSLLSSGQGLCPLGPDFTPLSLLQYNQPFEDAPVVQMSTLTYETPQGMESPLPF